MFGATVLPIFRSTLTVYTAFWDNVPTVLSAANRFHSQSAPEDGQNCRPKHVEQA